MTDLNDRLWSTAAGRSWDIPDVRKHYIERRLVSEADVARLPNQHSRRTEAKPTADWPLLHL